MEIESQWRTNSKAFNDRVLRTELKCSIDSVDLIPQIPRERFNFVLFPRIGGNNFSCDVYANVVQTIKYLSSNTWALYVYVISWFVVRWKDWNANISQIIFFKEPNHTNRKVKSTDHTFGTIRSFMSIFRPFTNAMKWQNVYAYVFPEPEE